MSERTDRRQENMVSSRSILALVAVVGALIPALGGGPSHWDAEESDAVREAVVRDLVTADMEVPHGSWRSVCICVWSGKEAFHGQGACSDPSPHLIQRLTDLPGKVLPYSQCAGAKKSLLLAIGRIDWHDAAFVKVGGAYSCGPLCGEGFVFTASFDSGKWSVDTAKLLWVS